MFPFPELCLYGDLEVVEHCLKSGIDVNTENGDKQTGLMSAAASCTTEDHVAILKILLATPSIEVNKADKKGYTALVHATGEGHISAVKLLLADQRVDVNCKNSPLVLAAARTENIDIFKLLLADGRVDVNQRNGNITPLINSSCNSNVAAAELLLDDPRVKVNWINSKGVSALHAAVTHKQTLQLFLAHPRVDVNCKLGPHGTTILHLAAAKNNGEAVKLILADSRFSSANAFDGEGGTAVTIAACKGNWEVLEELVHHPRIDLDVKQEDGLTIDDILRRVCFANYSLL